MSERKSQLTIVNYSSGAHFDEIVRALRGGFSSAFVISEARQPQVGSTNLILGLNAHLSTTPRPVIPPGSVLFNLEQLSHNWMWDSTSYLDYLMTHKVIDYSLANIEYLKKRGKSDIAHLPIRHHDGFQLQIPRRLKDIDVLLLGARSNRRNAILNQMRQRGLIVAQATELWGESRLELLGRAKLVVNVRTNHMGLLETTRLVTLASSEVPVISESSADRREDAFFSKFIDVAPVEELPELAHKIIQSGRWSSFYTAAKKAAYQSEAFEKRIPEICDFIGIHTKVRYSRDAHGDLLVLRNAALSEKGGAGGLVAAIDYALNWHGRTHDIEDFLLKAGQIDELPVILLLELYEHAWLPDQPRVVLKKSIIEKLAKGAFAQLTSYGKKLAATALARFGEVFLYLKVVESCEDSLALIKETIGVANFPGLAVLDAAEQLLARDKLRPFVRTHIAAELHWRANQTARAVQLYLRPEAREFDTTDPSHAAIVSERLARFGHHIGALTYYELSQSTLPQQVLENAYADANSCVLLNPVRRADEVAAALQRNHCFLGQDIGVSEHGITIGRISGSEAQLLSGDITIREARFKKALERKRAVDSVAVIACYNEVDVLEGVVRSFVEQGVKIHVVDNWSKDGTWELLNLLAEEIPSLKLDRYPSAGPSTTYDWKGLLGRKEEIALTYADHWVLHTDADEIRRSPWEHISLAEAFSIVEYYGCNAVDFAVLNFRPIDEGFTAGMNPETYFTHYEPGNTPDLKYQVKCWKQGADRVDLVSRGGHFVALEGRNIFPIKFLCKHYPLRSRTHAIRKIVTDRRSRFSAEERAMGWHSHYDQIDPGECSWDWKSLERFDSIAHSKLGYSLIHGL